MGSLFRHIILVCYDDGFLLSDSSAALTKYLPCLMLKGLPASIVDGLVVFQDAGRSPDNLSAGEEDVFPPPVSFQLLQCLGRLLSL